MQKNAPIQIKEISVCYHCNPYIVTKLLGKLNKHAGTLYYQVVVY